MRDHYMPASLLGCACLAVVTVAAFQAASSYHPPVDVHPTIHIDIGEKPVSVEPDFGTEVILPEQVITAPRPSRDPLSGPGKRCSEGAWFQPRPLVQGTGNVRGFCP